VVACDMPHAGADVFDALTVRAKAGGLDGAVLQTANGAEPLCAVYSTACLGAVRDALERGDRRMNSFWSGRDGLRQLQVKTFTAAELALAVDGERHAVNLNTPEDLAQERARVRGARNARNDRRTA
jgi:molybdopterin-guanine dinucleotide biosynthesis protein A